ncbi:MAG TPA: plastocyanin/azurin family copper-binding protein [Candidatus Sulfomarinibacteraceae bacterium]|nr:plastocyanin/azurin family copper-binding protein [Candidatus Sulfomarinibacteraceae bacterium]
MTLRRTLFILLLTLMLALAACGGQEVPAEAPTEAPVAEEPAAEEPEEEATEAPPPTEAPTEVPTEEPEEEPTAEPVDEEPARERVGLLRFRDDGDVRSGAFELLLDGIESPPEGSHYELWLLDESFNALNLGAIDVEGSGTYAGAVDTNLLGNYSSAIISVEPDGVDSGEIGPIVYEGVVPAESLLHVRHVNFQFPQNPDEIGFLIGAQEQAALAQEHAGFLQESLAEDDLAEAQRHAEHVVNILDGENGDVFGDLDGDGVAQNPGDGFGVRLYLNGAKQHAQFAAEAEGATDEVQLHAEHVVISSDNALSWLEASIEQAVRVISADSAAEAQPVADQLSELLGTMVQGEDIDGDGAIAPIPGEGGIDTAYEHAFNAGAFEFFAAGAQPPTVSEEAAPAEESDEDADDADEGEAPDAVVVDMVDFDYEPGDLTIPAGTTVTFVNQDQVDHSATLGDGSQDTGLYGPGEEASLTFDTPGEYIVYCTLHGTADGGGMAMTVTVTE